jgi:GT2 family glycosyltransferase
MDRRSSPMATIALAISAYRSDDRVIQLLRTALAPGSPRFGAVIVVDSLGSGAIEQAARMHGWDVHYVNADRNLGSAGNLDLRLNTAAALGLKWCFAVNHDGIVDVAKVEALARHGLSRSRVGAVYPQLIFSAARDRRDAPRRAFSPYGVLRPEVDDECSKELCSEVAWSSSNCALYNLDAVRDGATVWPELWMGYEDLALGWEMQRRGWVQLLCPDISVIDSYEFTSVRFFGRAVQLAAKPSWYMYYQLRNLALIARRSQCHAVTWSSLALRTMIDVGLVLIFRDHKVERLRLLFAGLLDGLRNVSGKGPIP